MNTQKLLEQFLGPNALSRLGGQAETPAAPTGAQRTPEGAGASGLGGMVGGVLGGLSGRQDPAGGGFGLPGGALGGLAAGGLLGVLLGQKKVREMAGGVLGYGGAAALGALAFRAYQNWQDGQQAGQGPAATAADAPQQGSRFAPVAGADGKPFALALIRSMIAAANADGHIGADEQKQIFEAASRGGLDAEDKAFIFDALHNPLSPQEIAALAGNQEQAAELYLAARVAIDPDHPDERVFLQDLARALALPGDLVSHLEAQVAQHQQT